jgi:anti-sigma-K factor RskA
MEELLRKLKIQSPPQGARERVLAAARAELQQAAEKRDWLDRLWESRAFWRSAAAVVLVCLVAIFVAPAGATPRQAAPVAADPIVVAAAKELAASLGDGPVLERRLIAQLSGTEAPSGSHELFRNDLFLLRNIQ